MSPRRRTCLAAAVLAALAGAVTRAEEAPGDLRYPPLPGDTYADQLCLRWWGGLARPDLYAARVAIHDENNALRSDFWEGGIAEGALTTGVAAGVEAGYGIAPAVRLLAALTVSGVSAQGTFDGLGPKTVLDPATGLQRQHVDRLTRFTEMGQEAGATLLVRDFGWCRFGLTGRLGIHELTGALERGRESGPFGSHWWNRQLTGIAPSIAGGLEWEWLVAPQALPFPLTGFVHLGWRWLDFTGVSFAYTDDTGAVLTGTWANGDGTHRALDFSGPEIRLGLQVAWSTAPS